jgi:hypothetical protein
VTWAMNVASGMTIQAVTDWWCNRYVAGKEEVYVTTQVVATFRFYLTPLTPPFRLIWAGKVPRV